MKRFLFRFFPLIAAFALAACVSVIFALDLEGKPALCGGVIAGVLGFCYFIQQQKLAETHLFKELFIEFNRRYDDLNDDLARLATSTTLSSQDKQILVDYFNLCAEEYLFFREGYILPEVWRSWCRGMLQYIQHEPFKAVWRDEIETESYYGLTETLIRRGAGLTPMLTI